MSFKASGPGYDAIKPRIFQIGFNKCGTRSFYDFFEASGIKSVHFKRGDLARGIRENLSSGRPPLKDWDKWTAYTDMQSVKKSGVIEACAFYRFFANYYPRSYFILNTRSKDRWIKSRLNHGTTQNYGDRYRLGLGLSTMDETVDAWSEMWDKHHLEVPAFFKETGQHFITYDIEQDKPEKLAEFLSPDFVTDPSTFGHQGKTSEAPQKAPAGTSSLPGYDPLMTFERPKKVSTPPVKAPVSDALEQRFQPRNDLVSFDESAIQAPYEAMSPKKSGDGWTGNLIVATMKDEAPFLLEWVAYHRAIGFNHFLIFTNDCTDCTNEMLQHLEKQGIVTHVKNDGWTGKSPQAAALQNVMKRPVVHESDWVVHIDADEFINIRTGDGTFDCLVKALPANVTNIAMTQRIFGSAGVEKYDDIPAVMQSDRCAPSYLPKPFNAWGFKTATRNIDAYQSLSSHRPGNIQKDLLKEVCWVNGSGKDITKQCAKSGWRSNTKTIGYDLVQLNHYPLRSLEAFLVKNDKAAPDQKNGGAGYWMRMDWNSYQDITAQRNGPRFTQELERLKSDPDLARLHDLSVQKHKERIIEIIDTPIAKDLIRNVKTQKLNDVSRVVKILENDTDTE